MHVRTILFASTILLAISSLADAREWTDTSGNQVTADFIRVHEGEVILRADSNVLRCPYDQFSDEDKAYIQQQIASSGKGGSAEQVGGSSTDDARELRTWTDIQGRKVLGQYVDFSLGQIELLKSGARISHDYSLFSATDQAYVNAILTEEGRTSEIPQQPSAGEESEYGDSSYDEGGYGENDYGAGNYSSPRMSSSPGSPGYGSSYYDEEEEDGYDEDEYEDDEPDYGPSHHSRRSAGLPPPGPSRLSRLSHLSYPLVPDVAPLRRDSSPPTFSTPSYEPECEMVLVCTRCKAKLPPHIGIGDKCPNCGVVFEYEEGADGKKRDASGNIVSGRAARIGVLGFTILGGIFGAVIFVVLSPVIHFMSRRG